MITVASTIPALTGVFGGVLPREPTERAISAKSRPWQVVSVASAHVAPETARSALEAIHATLGGDHLSGRA